MSDHCGADNDVGVAPPAAELVERLIEAMVNVTPARALEMQLDIAKLRRALDAARSEDAFALLDVAFGRAAAVGVEMQVRAEIALRFAFEHYDRRRSPGGQEFPRVEADAERFVRIARFLVDIGSDYAKIAHVAQLAKRKLNDPKLVDLDRAREDAAKKESGVDDRTAMAGTRGTQ